MSLAIPKHVEKAGISGVPIVHVWDDLDPEVTYLVQDDRLQHRIGQTSYRGVLAFSAGCAEWIAWRLAGFTSDTTLLQRIEATWAAIIDWRYLRLWEAEPSAQWQGPVRGPMWGASDMLRRIIDLSMREQFAFPEAVCLCYLTLHVTPNQRAFRDWRRFVIKRLAQAHPGDTVDLLGDPVPRESLDPDHDYKPESANELVARFLLTLNPAANPYLRSRSEMLEAGYQGTPYAT